MLPTEVTFIGFSVDWDERSAKLFQQFERYYPEPNNQYDGYH